MHDVCTYHTKRMNIVIASDHCGFRLKEQLLPYLSEGHNVIDCGCHSTEPVDFPDVAQALCQKILSGEAERGIMFCGTGVGAAIACNKIKGIRASVCHDIYSAHQAVEHDNVQIMTLGHQVIGYSAALDLINAFLSAKFSDDEEFRIRLEKLQQLEINF